MVRPREPWAIWDGSDRMPAMIILSASHDTLYEDADTFLLIDDLTTDTKRN